MRDDTARTALRTSRFEAYEERLALSASSLADLFGSSHDPLEFSAFEEPTPLYGDVATQANPGQAWTDVSYVRSNYGLTGAGQTVAIIDTGVAWDHVGLGAGLGAGSRIVGGWDFAENDSNPYDDGPAGFHGTHVAGIVGGQNASYPGVATGVDFVALRVFDDNGNGHFGWVEQSLQWVAQHRTAYANPITTVNLSIGTDWNSGSVPNWANLEDEFLALKNAGIVITVSAGNSFQTYNTPGLSYPAASPHVIPVASVSAAGNLSSFSQRNTRVLAGPGESIVSTVPDYLYSNDGIKNDFAAASGTSMAAPWVAGASVLVRQAMQQAGYVGINEDTIYNHLKSTADTIFDSVTSASYSRVNLRRAIDSLMTADDFGNSAPFAHSLGALGSGSATLTGRIGATDDVDYLSFTAATSGTARFTLQPGSQITGQWQVDGGASGAGATFDFNVIAGQTYFVRLGGGGTTGNWSLHGKVEPSDWGTVGFYLVTGRQATGSDSYQLTASQSGILTVEALFSAAAGNVNLEVYNASNQLLASSSATGDNERLDLNVTAGQQLTVRVTGVNQNVSFRSTNLVSVSGNTVTVCGAASDELFVFLPGNTIDRIAVNGVGYDFASSVISNYIVQGGSGSDTLVAIGTAAQETAAFSEGNAIVTGAGYSLNASSVEFTHVHAGSGNDVASFYDSARNDTFHGSPTRASLSGTGYSASAYGFDTASALFNAGGFDQTFLYGSIGSDRFEASSATAFLQGSGFQLQASGYDTVVATGGFGQDVAMLSDTAGNETFIGEANAGSLSGSSFYLRANNFERVEARSTGGIDVAYLWDSAGDDQFGGSKVLAYLNGSGFSNYVEGFDRVTGFSTGGRDTAEIFGTQGNDTFYASGRSRRIQASDYVVATENFRTVRTFAGGGDDTANLVELARTDTVNGRSTWFSVASDDLVNGYGFERVVAAAKAGQTPKSDVVAVDYLFQKTGW